MAKGKRSTKKNRATRRANQAEKEDNTNQAIEELLAESPTEVLDFAEGEVWVAGASPASVAGSDISEPGQPSGHTEVATEKASGHTEVATEKASGHTEPSVVEASGNTEPLGPSQTNVNFLRAAKAAGVRLVARQSRSPKGVWLTPRVNLVSKAARDCAPSSTKQ